MSEFHQRIFKIAHLDNRFYQFFIFSLFFRIAILMTGSGCCLNVLLPKSCFISFTLASDWPMCCCPGLWLVNMLLSWPLIGQCVAVLASDWSMCCCPALWLADVPCSPGDQVLTPGGDIMCDHCGSRLGLNTQGGQCRGNENRADQIQLDTLTENNAVIKWRKTPLT